MGVSDHCSAHESGEDVYYTAECSPGLESTCTIRRSAVYRIVTQHSQLTLESTYSYVIFSTLGVNCHLSAYGLSAGYCGQVLQWYYTGGQCASSFTRIA